MPQDICAKCGSMKIVPKVSILDKSDSGGDLNAYIDENPEAIFKKGRTYHALSAKVCGDCGYAEIYVTNYDKLYSTYEKTIRK